jgi:TRAP-type C4-dicarboxylate transport system substrate-binding protein
MEATMLQQVRLGAVEFSVRGDVVMESVAPAAGLSAIPFAFASSPNGLKAMDGPFGQYILASLDKLGIKSFPKIFDHGFRQTMNNVHLIHRPSDLKGLKIGLAPSYLFNSMFKALGAIPTVLDISEIYIGLQSRLIDGNSVPLQTFNDLKLYEVEKYVSLTNHIWTSAHLVANGDAWRRLPKNIQDICNRRFYDAAVRCGEDIERSDITLRNQLTGKGCAFAQPDRAAFRAALAASGVLTEWRSHYGEEGWAMLEKAIGPYH